MVNIVTPPLDMAFSQLDIPTPGRDITPDAAKSLATLIALRGLGRVAPNPLVGAVIVDAQHRFVSAGAHERIGDAHAEIAALRAAAANGLTPAIAGGTMYVTLEPCAHQNRTPACAPQVAASGVARVIYGSPDPNPKVSGRGAAYINNAGITCELDTTWTPACQRLAEVFLWTMHTQSPFVGLKVAMSSDGIMAKKGDQRAWITGPRARAYGHFLRIYYDAILVGAGTMLADDPTLDARDALIAGRTPIRVVLDPEGYLLQTRPDCAWRVLGHEPDRVLWLVSDQLATSATTLLDRLASLSVQVQRLAVDASGAFNPRDVLQALWTRGITSLLIEGGLGVYKSFLSAGCVNRLHLFQAPKLLGSDGDAMYFGEVTTGPLPFTTTSLVPLDQDWLVDASLTRIQ
ncbi:MAG: bifunctional diaminohydroxyphosphoribosylaminopyrimidine deaminase/5-amino-6-(5-phosphoribosylamino)uracil reductase RibD [Deltaproteobacteria bacterium]|nr:bifunctional diaminohydroxyphosphoribosylaminopyrimidine deaminase/5-amino-6-(5-phosphoribosylamino)uracil reductase RibD [Deltaproteobacteria bacterium]